MEHIVERLSDECMSLEKLVSGSWKRNGDGWRCELTRGWLLSVHWRFPTPPAWQCNLYVGSMVVASASDHKAVRALELLCEDPFAVAVLSALDAFPEVDEPDPAWQWWWWHPAEDGALSSAYHQLDGWELVSIRDGVMYCGDGVGVGLALPEFAGSRWRRAPAPPGWTPDHSDLSST